VTDLPRQIDRRVRQEIAGLNRPWRVIKKRDHYFLQVEDKPLICVANNSSRQNEWMLRRTIEEIRKV